MSSPEVRLTPAALEDLSGILTYSVIVWGEEQALAYRAALDKTCADLAAFPEMGMPRPRMGTGVRSLVSREHVVFYVPFEGGIEVARIIHSRMNMRSLRLRKG